MFAVQVLVTAVAAYVVLGDQLKFVVCYVVLYIHTYIHTNMRIYTYNKHTPERESDTKGDIAVNEFLKHYFDNV